MLFFEYVFLFLFLPAVLIGYGLVPRALRNGWLLLASLVFYAFTNLDFLPILLGSTLLDYVLGHGLARSRRQGWRRFFLIASVVLNLGILAYFKYSGLITTSLRDMGLESVPLLKAALPVGISFYTFQSMSYTIDLYRGKVPVARSLVDFATFVTLFPQLVAGPIVRYDAMHEQLSGREHTVDRFASGLALFIRGLAKKVILADTAAILCNPMFEVAQPGFVLAWVSVGLFAFQIYFDFSGYSDMAIGLGRLFGFEFPKNFDSPYKAESFSDFWRRWHITLSSWLRDNLYIPLGGSRRGPVRTYVNLFLTMLLGGLWHGASWNFVLWGAGHGVLLAVERLLGERNPLLKVNAWLRRGVVFVATTVLWVPFRCRDFEHSMSWFSAMVSGGGPGPAVDAFSVVILVALWAITWFGPNTNQIQQRYRWRDIAGLGLLFLFAVCLGLGRDPSPFLYFRF